jgi:hypothetical protein
MKLNSRLLTEMLEVRILPGEPNPRSVDYKRFEEIALLEKGITSVRIMINLD